MFFSFPHIAINAIGEAGKISRPNRPDSMACGALLKVLRSLPDASDEHSGPHDPSGRQAGQWHPNKQHCCDEPGHDAWNARSAPQEADCLDAPVVAILLAEHDALDPEYSILKHRVHQCVSAKGASHDSLDLVSLTKFAEEAITQVCEV